ncbi:MAG: pilus assembly protein PilM [Clostridia bacterium]|nr:pilus assembly protein PilM [Clostridia bacterium]
MAKTILGVDIGHDQLKLALVKGNRVLKTASAPMPENLLRQGHIASRETMGELIKSTMKGAGIRAGNAAIVLPSDSVFIKNVEMPLMSIEQLEYNLPFEFNDYITGELREYVFDYAVISDPDAVGAQGEGEEAPANTMELMAVGTQRVILEDCKDFLRKAGLRLAITAPAISAYISLIRAQSNFLATISDEFCVLDLGYESIRMYMFLGDKHVATRVLEMGMSNLDNVLADAYGVDVHLAHTYLMSNFENCQHREECVNAYSNIAVELMRALNFYRFSNPDSALAHMWLCGGGAVIEPLAETIGEMLSIELHPASELVPGGEGVEECNSFAQAIGITMG